MKLLNDPVISRTRVFATNAMAKESSCLIQMDLDQYHSFIISELEANIKEKVKYVKSLIPGISLCTLAQKEKIAYSLDIFMYPKGTILCNEGNTSDKLQIVLEGECSIIKRISGKSKIISKLGKGSFISENTVINGRPTEFTVIVASEKAKIGKFKNSDVKNNFPVSVVASMKEICEIKQVLHDRILKFSNLQSSASLPSKFFPLASPRALSNIAHIALRQANNYSCIDIKPFCKNKLDSLRDCSPRRIDKFYH